MKQRKFSIDAVECIATLDRSKLVVTCQINPFIFIDTTLPFQEFALFKDKLDLFNSGKPEKIAALTIKQAESLRIPEVKAEPEAVCIQTA